VTSESIHDDKTTKMNIQSITTQSTDKTNDTLTLSSEIFPTSLHISVASPINTSSVLDSSINSSSSIRDIIIGHENNRVIEELTDEEKERRRQAIAKEQQQRILQQVEEMRRRKQQGLKVQGQAILECQKKPSVSIPKQVREKSDCIEHDEELRKYQRERPPRTKGLLYRRFPGGKLFQVDRYGEPMTELQQSVQSNNLENEEQDDDDEGSLVSENITLDNQEVKDEPTPHTLSTVSAVTKGTCYLLYSVFPHIHSHDKIYATLSVTYNVWYKKRLQAKFNQVYGYQTEEQS
jgi:hypothetical protein